MGIIDILVEEGTVNRSFIVPYQPKMDRSEIQLIIWTNQVLEDHIEVRLKADIDSILKSGTLPEERPYKIQIIQESDKRREKVSLSRLSVAANHQRAITDNIGIV